MQSHALENENPTSDRRVRKLHRIEVVTELAVQQIEQHRLSTTLVLLMRDGVEVGKFLLGDRADCLGMTEAWEDPPVVSIDLEDPARACALRRTRAGRERGGQKRSARAR